MFHVEHMLPNRVLEIALLSHFSGFSDAEDRNRPSLKREIA